MLTREEVQYMGKFAGLLDYLGEAVGSQGGISSVLTGLGGAGLGAMAGRGNPKLMGLGALLGGGLGLAGANAINTQNTMQNNVDAALINGIGASLNANDQTDYMQNQAITQQNDTINQLAQALYDISQKQDMMSMGQMDPSMMGQMDPGMMGQMDPGMMGQMDPGMMAPPMQVDPMNNGLGPIKQGSLSPDQKLVDQLYKLAGHSSVYNPF